MNILNPRMLKIFLCSLVAFSPIYGFTQQRLSLSQAIEQAQANDPWQHGSELKQTAIEARSIASGSFPDPTISIGLLNLPTDNWNFAQENMTQFKVGVSQMFPRGNTLNLKRSQLKIESSKHPLLRQERRAKLTASISQIWLEAYLAQKTIMLISSDKALFEQIVDIAKASYSSAIGNTRQHDVIRAQLELAQLDDRLTLEYQNLESLIASLKEWLHPYDKKDLTIAIDFDTKFVDLPLTLDPPKIDLISPFLLQNKYFSGNEIAQVISNHPALLVIDLEYQVAQKNVNIANQQYKPQWGMNASYAVRDNAPDGMDRADFFSIGVTFDLPLFTNNRQDKQVSAAIAESQAVKTEKLLRLKSMLASIEKDVRHLKRLTQRQALYSQKLLKQTQQQAEAALTAYTNDDGDFAEVVRAKIAELNTKISALQIDVEALKAVARINYFFTKSAAARVTSAQGDK